MFHIGPGELVVILLLALIIFGPGKLPDVGRALGRTINEFRRSTRQIEEELTAPEARPAPSASREGAAPPQPAADPTQGGGQGSHGG